MLKYFYTLSLLLLIEMTMVSCQSSTHQIRNRSQNIPQCIFYPILIQKLNERFSNASPQSTTHQVDTCSQIVLRSIMKDASIDDLESIAHNSELSFIIEVEIRKNYSAHYPFEIDGSDPKNIKFLECFKIPHVRYRCSGPEDSNMVRLLQLSYIRSFEIVGQFGRCNILDLSNGNITDDKIVSLWDKLPQAIKQDIIALNLSGNSLTKVEGLDQFPNLILLNLANNRFESIEGLANFPRLVDLNLANNRLEGIEGLPNFPNLKFLNLANNHLESIEGLSNFLSLSDLNLANNRFRSVEGLSNFLSLMDLNLANNLLRSVEGLSNLPRLGFLNLANNRLESVEGLSNLPNLRFLNLANNLLGSVESLSNLRLYKLLLVNNCLTEEELNKLPFRLLLRLHRRDVYNWNLLVKNFCLKRWRIFIPAL